MIPLYKERADAPVGGAPEIFVNEHEKLRQYLVLFKAEMPKLSVTDDLERDVLFLLDSQCTFKRLLVHHDTRERKMLYALLDQVTTEDERAAILASLELSLTSTGQKQRQTEATSGVR